MTFLINCQIHAQPKELVFRPITITVLDEETKKPLKGIIINVINVTIYINRKIFFIPVEQNNKLTHQMYVYETDEMGVVEIPGFFYEVEKNIFLYKQGIIINLDCSNKNMELSEKAVLLDGVLFYSKGDNRYYRPLSEYKAGYILSKPFPMPEKDWYQLDNTKPYITTIFNGHIEPNFTNKEWELEPRSFFCDYEEFTFYLELFEEKN